MLANWTDGSLRLALLAWLVGLVGFGTAMRESAAATLTNVTVANVTPGSFSVVWTAAAAATGAIQVFADAAGTSNLAGQVGVEFFPLRTGFPGAANAYEQRQSMVSLSEKTRSFGLQVAKVSGLQPDTTYYFRLAAASGGLTNFIPSSGPLPSVRTAHANSFLTDAFQLLLTVPGLDVRGRVVTLTHTNSPYALATVVGDGAGTNQVIFNVTELLDLSGLGNFSPSGSQEFDVVVRGTGPDGGAAQQFVLDFTGAFAVAQTVLGSFSTEIAALSVGSTVTLAGQTSSVPIAVNSTVALSQFTGELDIPDGHLTNFTLQAVAAEVDPAQLSLTRVSSNRWSLNIQTLAGQQVFGARELCRLSFVGRTNVPSAFVYITPMAIQAFKAPASPIADVILQSGRAVVIGREPLIEPFRDSGQRRVAVYGRPWSSFAVEYSTNVNGGPWQEVARFPATTNLMNLVGPLPETAGVAFYRAADFEADPPSITIAHAGAAAPQLLVFGQRGASYTLQSATSLTPPVMWTPVLTFSLTNSFHYLGGAPTNNSTAFFRLLKN